MNTVCTRCEGTGFLNHEEIPEEYKGDHESAQFWIDKVNEEPCYCSVIRMPPCSACTDRTHATVCDCCGNSHLWYGEPGQHYSDNDPPGMNGPYAYNGGHCECH